MATTINLDPNTSVELSELLGGAIGGGVFAAIAAVLFIAVLIGIGVYLYTSWAFYTIAKKTRTEPAWLAWIPVANLYLFSKIAKMRAWPLWLLLVIFIPFLNIIAGITLSVFTFIWLWKIFERVGRPGWWVLLALIPSVGGLIFLVLLGFAAWGNGKVERKGRKAKKKSRSKRRRR